MLIYSNIQMYMSMQGPLMGHGTSFYIYSVYIVCVYMYTSSTCSSTIAPSFPRNWSNVTPTSGSAITCRVCLVS